MSRLRWPDSMNSVSDVPGTIQFVAREAYNGLIKDHRSRTVVEDAA